MAERQQDGPRRRPLTAALILQWADDHQRRTGTWPTADSGPVAAAPAETWAALQAALRFGCRGLPGGDSLARLLRRERALPERRGRRPDLARKANVARLREGGLSLAEIGRRLGITRQAVHAALRDRPPGDAVA